MRKKLSNLLNKYNKDNLFESIGYLGGGQLLKSVIDFVVSIIFIRYTSQEIYGTYQLIISYFVLGGTFTFGGLNTALEISAAKNKHGNYIKIIKKKLLYTLFGSIVLSIIGVIYLNYNVRIAYLLFIGSLIFPFYTANSLWISWLTGKQDYKRYSFLHVLNSVIILFFIGGALIVSENRYIIITLALVGNSVLGVFILYYEYLKINNHKTDSNIISYGISLSLANIINSLIFLDKPLIEYYVDIEMVAIYSVALILPNKLKLVYQILKKSYTPVVAKAESLKDAWEDIKHQLFMYGIFVLVITIGGIILIPIIIPLVFGESYSSSVDYAIYLWIVKSIAIITTIISDLIIYQMFKKFALRLSYINAISKFILLVFFIPNYGIWGAVYAIVLSEVLNSSYTIYFFFKNLNHSYES